MPIRLLDPVRVEEFMHPSALSNDASQALPVRVGDSHGVIPARTQPPNDDLVHLDSPVKLHPIQNTAPQPLAPRRIRRIGRTVGRARDLDNDRCPPTREELVASGRVVGPVAIQAGHQDDCRHLAPPRGGGKAHIGRDVLSVPAGPVGERDPYFGHGVLPLGRRFHVDVFLQDPSFPFRRVVHAGPGPDVGEARDAVETRRAEVESAGFTGVVLFVALLREPGRGREERSRVLDAGAVVGVVLRSSAVLCLHPGRAEELCTYLDQLRKHGLEILFLSIVEGVYT